MAAFLHGFAVHSSVSACKGNFHALHEKRGRVHSVRKMKTLPGQPPDSERIYYGPVTSQRKTPTSPQEVSVVHLHMVVQGSRTRRARPLQFVLHNAILLARAAGEQYSHLVCSLPSHGLAPTMADFRPGGSRRFGASLRSQYRSCGVWIPLSFYAGACPVGRCGHRLHWINRLSV